VKGQEVKGESKNSSLVWVFTFPVFLSAFTLPSIVCGLRQFLHLVRGVLHGLDDVVIAGATAKISLEPVTNLGLAWIGVVLEQIGGAHDHAWRAVAALQAVHFPEAFLQWVQVSGLAHAFDGRDGAAIDLDREHRAGFHCDTIDVNGAGSALAGVTPNVRAGQVEGFTQVMDQKRPWFNV
jgi:hypothetical protein